MAGMEQLGIWIALELIYRYHPCFDRYGNCTPCRVSTWMHMTENENNMTRSLEQVHYKMYGTLR
jgi:hypothetical protein